MMKLGKKLLVFFALLTVLALSNAPQHEAGDEIIITDGYSKVQVY